METLNGNVVYGRGSTWHCEWETVEAIFYKDDQTQKSSYIPKGYVMLFQI